MTTQPATHPTPPHACPGLYINGDHMNLYTESLEYATLGYSRSTVAGILGYSRPHFTQYVLPRIDPDNTIPWPSRGWSRAHQEAIAEGVGRGPEWRENQSQAAKNRRRV